MNLIRLAPIAPVRPNTTSRFPTCSRIFKRVHEKTTLSIQMYLVMLFIISGLVRVKKLQLYARELNQSVSVHIIRAEEDKCFPSLLDSPLYLMSYMAFRLKTERWCCLSLFFVPRPRLRRRRRQLQR